MKQREKLWTNGPWVANYEGSVGHVKSTSPVMANGGTPTVARFDVITPSLSDEEKKANGQLISAAPDLVEEHEEWASLLGEVYMFLQQADYSEAKRLLDQAVTIDFKANNGAPSALSPALDKAYGQSPCKACGNFGSDCDACANSIPGAQNRPENLASEAVMYADALLAELEKSK